SARCESAERAVNDDIGRHLSFWTCWIGVVVLVMTAAVPLGERIRLGRRALPLSQSMRIHAAFGLTTTAAAVAHAMSVLPALGSPAAVGGGMAALAPGAVAFFLLFAHVGVGLQLRSPKLRERAAKRRLHVILASGIATMIMVHVVLLLRAG